jgi:hypothetical protein
MFNKWTDYMVRRYFDTHLNCTLDEVCALSGRKKADVKSVLLDEILPHWRKTNDT